METTEKNETGSYVIGMAVIIAAILLSLTLYVGMGDLQKAIKGITVTVAGNNGTPAGNNNSNANGNSGGQADGWSFIKDSPSIGPASAKVTVIEFSDFQCPFCGLVWGREYGGTQYDSIRGTVSKVKKEFVDTGKVRFVFVPMAFLGQESIDAANAALCVREAGGDAAFFKMHDALFAGQSGENQGAFNKAALKKFAADSGYNTTAVMSCIDSGKYVSQVQAFTTSSNTVGVSGTPMFAINNKVVENGADYNTLKNAINAALSG